MLEMFSQKMRRRIDPMEMTILGQDGKIHPPSASRSGLILDKQIRVNKDVNGIAVTSDNILLLACGTGTLGGLCTLDLDTEQTTLHQKGRHFRQIGVDTNGTIYTSTQDTIHTYRIDSLDSPASVISPGPKVWGLCKTEDDQFIFGDIKKKKVYRNNNQGNSLVAQKTEENHIKSVWSLACSGDRLYISDRKKRQVVCTDLKNGGAYMWRQKLGRPFPKYKRAFEDMATNYFGGLCTDAAGNIFVCDTANDRLSYITRDGAMTHYDNLGLDGPAHVATNGSTVVVADCVTILDCMVKVYKPSTSL